MHILFEHVIFILMPVFRLILFLGEIAESYQCILTNGPDVWRTLESQKNKRKIDPIL